MEVQHHLISGKKTSNIATTKRVALRFILMSNLKKIENAHKYIQKTTLSPQERPHIKPEETILQGY